ncbi:carbohydrate-binding domain-containing protein [Arthrobacter citreus]|uniref:carbohydrate-binding domain-containing protein n=1 Tax=Arthrobacter TaxID=1663 RepID=UPI0012653207|nr:carbohydrate-binding domain-containing protein [Arthrobacter gandavensis]
MSSLRRTVLTSTSVKTSVAALALAVALSGCAGPAPAGTGLSASGTENSGTAPGASVAAGEITEDTHFDADDLTWDTDQEIRVDLGSDSTADGVSVNGETVTITAAGTYRLSGSHADGQVVVAAGEEDVVRVILDGVNLASSSGSPFVAASANEVILYLEEGTSNTLSDAGAYADTADDAPNAALYSTVDLTIAGTGALNVTGNAFDGIVSKDGLVLAAGDVTVNAVDEGIKGKDYLVLAGGRYNVTAGDDGVKSTNDEDENRGWLSVYGGELTVSSGDDAVKAETLLTVHGGTVKVSESVEGMEAAHIMINGGTIDITASDDGINAAGGSTTDTASTAEDGGRFAGEPPAMPEGAMPGGGMPEGAMPGGGMGPGGGEMAVGDYSIVVTGGNVTVNADGDGLDSNGNATVSGGTVTVHGPTNNGNGALDVNGTLAVDGGTLIAAGSAGMAQGPAATSAQSGVQLTWDTEVSPGTLIRLADAKGTVIASFTPLKETASLVYSSPGIAVGETYTAYTGGTEGSLDGAEEAGSAVGGEYSQGFPTRR